MTDEEVPSSDLPDNISNTSTDEEVPQEDMPQSLSAEAGDEVPASDLPDEALQNKYGTPGQQALTIGEHLVKGVAGPVATYGEQELNKIGVPGFSNQDILGREQANPNEATLSELGGNAALVSVPILGEAGLLAKAGASALKWGLIQAGNEKSKAMLGQGDPSGDVARHIAFATGLGLIQEPLFGAGNALASKILPENMSKILQSFTTGAGYAGKYGLEKAIPLAESVLSDEEKEGLHNGAFKLGQNAMNLSKGKAGTVLRSTLTGGIGSAIHGWQGYALGQTMEAALDPLLKPYMDKLTAEYAGPALLRMASSGTMEGIGDVMNYACSVAKGDKMLSGAVKNLFESGTNKIINNEPSEKDRNDLKENIENNTLEQQLQQNQSSQQRYAEGGEVKPPVPIQLSNGISKNLPEHNVLLNTAKSRVFNYLKSAKPMKENKLPFDMERPNLQKEHEYNKTLDLANQPLSILNNVKDGSLTPNKMSAFTSMYPELHDALSKKIMEHVVDKVHNKERPPHKLRQSLSLFLGQDLDSSVSQPNILAAQAVFMQQKAQQPPQKADPALDKMGQSSMTPSQGREMRLNKN